MQLHCTDLNLWQTIRALSALDSSVYFVDLGQMLLVLHNVGPAGAACCSKISDNSVAS